jgi:glycolate oxidase subunit GlcD
VHLPASLLSELRAIVGDRHVITRAPALLAYESDALPGYRARPALGVFPGTQAEVIAVVQALHRHATPFVARGAGTGLSGGALADDIVLLGVHRLKRIIAIDPLARTARVEPGVVNVTLTAAVAPHGLHYAPDPSSQAACTIGGNVAENAGGPHCLKYGVTLNHIAAATIVLPDGRVTTLHAPTTPDAGPDLLGAFIGSEGCFGVALELTVRLTPDPAAVRTLLADFLSLDDAANATTAIVAAGILPAACEMMDRATIAAVEASQYAAGYPTDASAVLLVEVDGTDAAVAEDADRIETICRTHGARAVLVAHDAAARARLWQGRKKAFGAMGRIAPHLVVQDAVVPRSVLAPVLAAISAIGARHGLTICNVFHAGDGNLHPNIPYDANDPVMSAQVHAAMQEVMATCIAAGGTISGEHGVGLDKLAYMDHLFTPDTLDAMCRLRSVFDPDRRANPGKVVPVHSCREWLGTAPGPRTGAPIALPPAPAPSASADGIIEYRPADLTITVSAALTLAELDACTRPHQQWAPLLPWGDDTLTVGEVLARGLTGPTRTSLGAPRDLTLGLTLRDHRGATISAGGRVVKNVAGFDLTRLVIGAGTALGRITQASLRLRARPQCSEAWAIPSDALDHAAWDSLCRGPYAPLAAEAIPSDVAAAIGLHAIAHHLLWIAGNAAQVAATRPWVAACGPAVALDADVWTALRRHGPFAEPRAPELDAVARELQARVVAAFTAQPTVVA